MKVLLQNGQLYLQAMIVIDNAYPDATTFDSAMEGEFNEQVNACLESGGTFLNPSCVQYDDNSVQC